MVTRYLQAAGLLAIADTLKPEAPAAVAELRGMGLEVAMLILMERVKLVVLLNRDLCCKQGYWPPFRCSEPDFSAKP